jgi:soluble lytic murein transglycosylase
VGVDERSINAHTLQESQFRTDAVSPAGARGLMQLMPATAQLIARKQGQTIDTATLNQPSVNMAFGQAYLEQLRDASGTGGLLPKVIAAYNAGPGAVMKWNDRARDRGDPLLFIESIPFVETRGYVTTVLRNYWMYQRGAGEKSNCLRAMVQYMWPRFPGLPGKMAVRIDPLRGTAAAE